VISLKGSEKQICHLSQVNADFDKEKFISWIIVRMGITYVHKMILPFTEGFHLRPGTTVRLHNSTSAKFDPHHHP